jgi:hypothetical protein
MLSLFPGSLLQIMLSDNLHKLRLSFALETLEVAIMGVTVAGVELNHEPESAIHGCAYQRLSPPRWLPPW